MTIDARWAGRGLENVQQIYDTAAVQRSHWQLALGRKNGTGFDSS
jgi:hypothetical protein